MKFENDEVVRIEPSCTCTVLWCYILEYIDIGQIAKRRINPMMQNTLYDQFNTEPEIKGNVAQVNDFP